MVKGSSGRGEMEGATASGSTERRDQAHHPGRLSLLKWGASLLRLQRCDTKPFFFARAGHVSEKVPNVSKTVGRGASIKCRRQQGAANDPNRRIRLHGVCLAKRGDALTRDETTGREDRSQCSRVDMNNEKHRGVRQQKGTDLVPE
jgi:hypothetical protein